MFSSKISSVKKEDRNSSINLAVIKAHNVNVKRQIEKDIEDEPDDFVKLVLYLIKLTLYSNISAHIREFIHDLIKYTQITYDNLLEILSGAYVIIKFDNGHFYKKYKPYNYMIASSAKIIPETSHYSYIKGQPRVGKKSIISPDYYNHPDGEEDTPEEGNINNQFDLILGTLENSKFSSKKYIKKSFSTWFQFEEAKGVESGRFIGAHMFSKGHIKSTIKYGALKLQRGVLDKMRLNNYGLPLKNIGPLGQSLYNEKNPLIIPVCKDTTRIKKKINRLVSCKRYSSFFQNYSRIITNLDD